MTKIDLRNQVQGILPRVHGGTNNAFGAADTWVIVRLYNDSGATIAVGSVVTKTLATPSLHRCSVAGQPIIGVIVGYYPDGGGPLVPGDCPVDVAAAICVSGFVRVLTTSAGAVGQYLAASTTAGKATPATTKPTGAFGYVTQAEGAAACHAMIGNIESVGAIPPFATPAVVLGVAAAAGAATSVIRSDSTIAAFDAVSPTTQAFGDSAVVGTAAFATRRDHKHGIPAIFDATDPTTIAFGDVADDGAATVAAKRDHRHGAPANPAIGPILISDTHSTPLVFDDLLQNDDGDDLLYADVT